VPEKYTKKQALVRRMIVRCQAKLSDYIITDSEYSKKDICKRLGVSEEKVGLVYISVEQKKDIVKMETEDYFLFVSETEKAKNLMELVNAYALLPEEIKDRYMVYVVGKKGNDYENIINRLRELGLFERFKFFGYLSDDELDRLYAKAYAFVFPSFFEGFGLPVIEAMAKGTPVLCSDTSSIPEVGGDAVLTFSPYDAGELAKKLCLIVNTEGLRETMIQKGLERVKMFNSETTARETMEIFKRIIENG
jgi:glycosyltransferase involved in cell wall biosynthesis